MTEEPTGGGGVARDLRQLFADVADWARSAAPGPDLLHTGPECGWCPVCQFVDVVKGEHPEVGERLKQAGTAVIGAVVALAEAAAQPPKARMPREEPAAADAGPAPDATGSAGNATGAGNAGGPARRPDSGVEHIPLDFGGD